MKPESIPTDYACGLFLFKVAVLYIDHFLMNIFGRNFSDVNCLAELLFLLLFFFIKTDPFRRCGFTGTTHSSNFSLVRLSIVKQLSCCFVMLLFKNNDVHVTLNK